MNELHKPLIDKLYISQVDWSINNSDFNDYELYKGQFVFLKDVLELKQCNKPGYTNNCYFEYVFIDVETLTQFSMKLYHDYGFPNHLSHDEFVTRHIEGNIAMLKRSFKEV